MGGLVTQYVTERKNQIETSDQPKCSAIYYNGTLFGGLVNLKTQPATIVTYQSIFVKKRLATFVCSVYRKDRVKVVVSVVSIQQRK